MCTHKILDFITLFWILKKGLYLMNLRESCNRSFCWWVCGKLNYIWNKTRGQIGWWMKINWKIKGSGRQFKFVLKDKNLNDMYIFFNTWNEIYSLESSVGYILFTGMKCWICITATEWREIFPTVKCGSGSSSKC